MEKKAGLFYDRKSVQQIMLGTVCKTEAQTKETLRCIKQAGYDGIELNGFMIRPTPFIVRMLTKFAGMPVGKGGKYHWKELLTEAGLHASHSTKILARSGEIRTPSYRKQMNFKRNILSSPECIALIIPIKRQSANWLPISTIPQTELKKSGIRLSYHNHNCEFRKVEPGLTAYELLIRETDPDLVGFEFDSYLAEPKPAYLLRTS